MNDNILLKKFMKNRKKLTVKQKRIQKENFFKNICLLYIIIGFALFGFGMKFYYEGFHSLDTGHNIIKINYVFDTSLIDMATNFKTSTAQELYINGIKQQEVGQIMIFISGLMFGIGLMGYTIKNKK